MQRLFGSSFNRFLALSAVILIGTVLPFSASQAAPMACGKLFELGSIRTEPLPKWTQLQSANEKRAYIQKTFQTGAKTFFESQSFAKNIRMLPLEQRQDWLRAIAKVYRQVPKKDPSPFAAWHIGGRRLLDHALTLLENYPLQFQFEIVHQERPARQVYEIFLNRQAEMFNTGSNGKAVSIVISTLQAELQKINQLRPGNPVSLSMSGSFPNGKADLLNSDIDLSISDGGAIRWTGEWQNQVDAALKNAGVESQLTLAFSTEPPSFYGKINPISIQITEKEIQMLVFPAATTAQSGDQLIANPPDLYLFK
jgi:hypothetical protein